MEELVAEYTVREVKENGLCKVQYVSHGKVLYEGKEYPVSLHGHPYFSRLVSDTLSILSKDKGESNV